ncbi:OmpA family protein [Defluviimonas salinarum]|uniref:OmpA family protein n=1 Tax=Defluviimonas salinarum TaxID=2992147 RepID=A0ABT3J7A6_9RHOB|nr:OmpA family protein [Defluviimonas salinarum]MCW3783576.1 OmpA family protein [Defluviimonas salinarum]
MPKDLTSATGRRSFLAGAAAFGGLLVAARGHAAAAMPAHDPWENRAPDNGDRIRLGALAREMDRALIGLPLEPEMMQDHLRLRIPAAMLFVNGKDRLSEDGVALLTLIAPAIIRQKRLRAEIVAHHGQTKSDYQAWMFTRRRAQAVRAALMSRGADGSRLKETGLGAKFPLVPGTDAAAQAANRRIEILFRPL